jgi:serine protease Do
METLVMTNDDSNEARRPRSVAKRRVALLTSAALVAVAGFLAGPGYRSLHLPAWTEAAHAQGASEAATPPTQRSTGFADLVQNVKPAVVSVRVRIEESANTASPSLGSQELTPGSPMQRFFQQFGQQHGNLPQQKEIITGEGSGFFISRDGYIVTNNHVVDHAKNVQVTTDDGTTYKAKVIGTDPKTDLALIKVDADKTFPFVKFAEQTPRVGDWVVAVGNPFGLGGTVTAGIISARGRDIGSGPYDDYIQIDAPINKGNSGGPAFDTNGNVIGVNTAIVSPSGGSVGIGFDIPAPTAKIVIAQLKAHGYVNRAWLGVQVQPVSADIADSLGLKQAQGAIVDEPQANSPAAKAGINAGDVITAVNGKPVTGSRELARTIGMMAPDTSVKLTVVHQGEVKDMTVSLGQMPSEKTAMNDTDSSHQSGSSVPHLGLTLAPAQDVAGAGGTGLAVVNVDPAGAAAQRGIQTGDVILDVGGKAVSSGSDLTNALQSAKASGRPDVLVRVKTSDATRFVALPTGKA